MQIENHKEEVPFSHYADLFSQADPAQISTRLGLKWENGEIYVNLLGVEYAISHPEYAIRTVGQGKPCPYSEGAVGAGFIPPAASDAAPALPTQTFLLRYLLEGKRVSWQGQWLTFREMPWGELYIQPYTGRVLKRAAFTLGTRIDAFRAAAEKLGFTPIQNGDFGCQAELLPGCFMRIIAWSGDEEFPPNAQVLYSDNFADTFAAEDRVVAGDILISALKAAMAG